MALSLTLSPLLFSQEFDAELDLTVLPTPVLSTPALSETNISVVMRDGVSVSLDVYRPTTPGQYPTLYASSPYPHFDDELVPNNALTGPIAWFVSQGYNYVLASTRGTGLSEGSYELLSKDEQQDHYELIEWIAVQAWSNGKVAGVGASYYSSAQWQMAIQNPPHLECIAPFNGVVQPYQDWAFPGGLASTEFLQDWYTEDVRMANAFPAKGTAHIIEYDMALQMLLHPSYDDYWHLRSPLEYISQINVPVFSLRTWDQDEPGLAGTINAHAGLNSANKFFIINEGREAYLSPTFLQQELMPFYEWCLGDEQVTSQVSSLAASYVEQSPVRYFTQGSNQLNEGDIWPVNTSQNTALFLNRQVNVEEDISSLNFSTLRNNFSSSEYGVDTQASSIRFLSDVLEQDIEIAGAVLMELYANSTNREAGFEVVLSEQEVFRQITQNQTLATFLPQDNGSSANLLSATNNIQVSKGVYKASPLSPNRVSRIDIALTPSAYRFKRGNRILIEIRKSVDGSLANIASKEEVYHNARYPSRLWLPIVQESNNNTEASPNLPVDVGGILGNSADEQRASFDLLNTDNLEDEGASPFLFIRD